MLSPLFFAIVFDVVTENERKNGLFEILYVDNLVLISEIMDDLKRRFCSYKEGHESKNMKVNTPKN